MEWPLTSLHHRICLTLVVCACFSLSACAALQDFPGRRQPLARVAEPPDALRPPDERPAPLSPAAAAPRPVPEPAVPPAPAVTAPQVPPAAVSSRPVQAFGQMPTLPLTTFGDRLAAVDLDNKSFSLTFAQPIAIQDLLLLIVRGTELSIVPDQGVGGSFIGELKRVTVRQALGLILPPLGLDYAATGGFIHVFRRKPEMRLFDVNVASAQRTATSTTGSGSRPGSTAQVSTMTTIDPYADLAKGLQMLLSEQGTFTLDRTAGLLHVIDFPDRLDRVEAYLDALHDRVHRQVQIDVQVIEVTLTAPRTRLDWAALSQASMEEGAPAAAPRPRTGLRVADLDRLLTALAQQGTVSTMAHPRVLALNNEPAIVHAAGRARDEITLVVTPQIGSTGVITLSVSPLVSRRPASGDEDVRADVDTLARVADGETVVLASLAIADQVEPPSPGRRARSVPTSVPTRTKTHGERLVLLTPKVLASRAD